MTDTATRETPFETPAGPVDGVTCPECGEPFDGVMAKARMGRHRRDAHGVAGEGSHKKRDGSSSSSTKRRSSPSAGRAPRFDYEGTVHAWYKLAGDMWAMRDPVCGGMMQQIAPQAAASWAELARTSEGVRKFIQSGAATGGWFGLAMAHAPLIFAVQHHHVIPAIQRRQAAREGVVFEEPGLEPDEGPAPDYGWTNGDTAAAATA